MIATTLAERSAEKQPQLRSLLEKTKLPNHLYVVLFVTYIIICDVFVLFISCFYLRINYLSFVSIDFSFIDYAVLLVAKHLLIMY